MKEAIVIISAFFLLTQGTAMAAQAGRDRIERGMIGYGRGYDCSSLTAHVKLKLTVEQAIQLRALDETCAREIDPIREQLYDKGRELKTEWLQLNPDRSRIEALRGEAAKLRERLHATLIVHRTEVLKVLTPEQQAIVPDDGPGRVFYKYTGTVRR